LQPESSTASSASMRTVQALTKRKSLLVPMSNAKSRTRPNHKSPPELLADLSKQNRRSTKMKPRSVETETSAPSQVSVKIKTNFRRLVDGEPQQFKIKSEIDVIVSYSTAQIQEVKDSLSTSFSRR